MESIKDITLHFNLNLSEIQNDFDNFISDKCKCMLINNIYEGYFIKNIIKQKISKDKKINLNGSISVKVFCNCEIIDPIIDSVINITINDINKMGYSYKMNKICIFVPNHLCNETYILNQNIQIKIIGKRIEEEIICIGQPI